MCLQGMGSGNYAMMGMNKKNVKGECIMKFRGYFGGLGQMAEIVFSSEHTPHIYVHI